jgi:hypothetical protein
MIARNALDRILADGSKIENEPGDVARMEYAMIENWKTLLLTFVVGAFVYLFSVASTEYGQIRKAIVKEASSYSARDGNRLRFAALVRSVTDRQRRRVESLRVLEHNAPTEHAKIDTAILTLRQAERDCAADIAFFSGFSPLNDSVAHAQRLLLAMFVAENDLRNAIIVAVKGNTLNGSPEIARLDAQLIQKAQKLFSALEEEEGQLKDLEDVDTSSISEYDDQYNVLGIKILSALFLLIVGSVVLIVTFLRERNRKLSQERFDQGLSA